MKKALSIMLAILMIVAMVPVTSLAITGERTIYIIAPSYRVGTEDEPFTVCVGNNSYIVDWIESTYIEKFTLETDYKGNVPQEGYPAIYKCTFADSYKYANAGSGTFELTDASVYFTDKSFDIEPEDLSSISFVEPQDDDPLIIKENETAFVTDQDPLPYYSTNNGTLLYAYTNNPFVNNGTILDGEFSYVENNGVISGGKYRYHIINKGTINGGDFSNSSTVIFNHDGATISDEIRETTKVVSSQPVTLNLTKLTHNAKKLVTTPGKEYSFSIFADEGCAVPETVQITIGGELCDNFGYYISEDGKSADIYVWDTFQTAPIVITAAGAEATFSDIGTLSIGETYIINNSVIRATSGEGWSFNSETSTLTLKNATITKGLYNSDSGIFCDGDLNIILEGSNLIDLSADTDSEHGIYTYGTLTITGTDEDSLTIKTADRPGSSSYGIDTDDDLVVSGATLNVFTGSGYYSRGISTYIFTIKDNAFVNVKAGAAVGFINYGIDSSSFILESGTVYSEAGENDSGYGIGIDSYRFVAKNGVVTAKGNQADIFSSEAMPEIGENVTLNLDGSRRAAIMGGGFIWNEETREFVCPGHSIDYTNCSGDHCEICNTYIGEEGTHTFEGEVYCIGQYCSVCDRYCGTPDPDNHNWYYGECNFCGELMPDDYVCAEHNWNYAYRCYTCGYRCLHENEINGKCTACEKQQPIKLISEDTVTYYENFNQAYEAAKDGDTIALADDYYDYSSKNIEKAITIDTNGYTYDSDYKAINIYANATLTDSVGDGCFRSDIVVYNLCTFTGGFYYWITLAEDAEVTLLDLVDDCHAYYYDDEKTIPSIHDTGYSYITIKADHPEEQLEEVAEKVSTCTEAGYTAGKYCNACGTWADGHKEIPAGHKNTKSYAQQDATCTEIGYTAGTYCEDCQTWIDGHEEIPAGHKNTKKYAQQDATCTEIGYTAGTYCEDCQAWIDGHKEIKGKHSYKDVITPATYTANGKIESKCSVCGVVKSSTKIAKVTSVTLSTTDYVYNGKNKTPKVTVKDANGNVLTKNVDYKLSVASQRSGIGRYTVKVTLIGKYSGTKNVFFYIRPGKADSVKSASQTTSSVKLSWSAVPGAAGYTVYRYSPSKKAYVKAGTTSGTSLTVKSLNAGTKYTFRVVAYGKTSAGKVYVSDSYALLKTATKTKTPELTKVTSPSKGKATLTWSAVDGETGYQVYYSTNKDSGFKKYANFAANSKSGTVTGLTS
ncbi:MAG: hypothetical protein IKY78_00675, partial [Clostridia bacterium]|nr:hypothetical protein [Clostridia bacterium]